MRVVLMGALALASTMMLANTAEARDGCGRGFYFNGVRCAPMRYAPPPYYMPPPPPPPRYAPRGWAPAFVDNHGQQLFYPGRRGSCPRGYTVQSGFCRPYRGY